MSTGFATAVDGFNVSAYERAEQEAIDRDQQHRGWVELGYQTLGYEQVPQKEGGLIVGYQWQQRGPGSTAGLPAGVVAEAKAAVAVEQQARTQLMTKYTAAREYLAKHSLSSEAQQVHVELSCAEAATAHRAASDVTQRAMHALGRIAEEVNEARATIAADEPRKRAIERQAAALTRDADQDVERARGVLLKYGVS